jgi:hypothetical protein
MPTNGKVQLLDNVCCKRIGCIFHSKVGLEILRERKSNEETHLTPNHLKQEDKCQGDNDEEYGRNIARLEVGFGRCE